MSYVDTPDESPPYEDRTHLGHIANYTKGVLRAEFIDEETVRRILTDPVAAALDPAEIAIAGRRSIDRWPGLKCPRNDIPGAACRRWDRPGWDGS